MYRCKPCNITTGFAGAGAYSDGKLSLSPDVGGNLPKYLGYSQTQDLINYVDDVYLKFGADKRYLALIKKMKLEKLEERLFR